MNVHRMKEKGKRPTHSAFENTVWIYQKQWRYVKGLFVLTLLMIPVGLGSQFLGIYLPKLAVQEVLEGREIAHAALRIGLTVGGLMLLHAASAGTKTCSFYLCSMFRSGLHGETAEKILRTDYQNLESPAFRDMSERAQRTLWASGPHSPLTRMAASAAELTQFVLGYFLFGSIVAFTNVWMAAALTVTPLLHYALSRRYHEYEYRHRENWTPLDRKIGYIMKKSADFAPAKDIRLYGLGDWFMQTYRTLRKERMLWNGRLLRRSLPPVLAELTVILLRDGAAYWILISMALRGEISVDDFVLCFAAVGSFASMVGGIFSKLSEIHSISLSVCDLRDFLTYPDAPRRGEGGAAVRPEMVEKPCAIDLREVRFRYEGAREDTLKGITLHVEPGEKLAIVGRNGAGKTTLVKTLCGLYRPTGGEIRISGHEAEEMSLQDYFSLFATVFQDFHVLPVSVAETVSSKPREEADDGRVEECLRLAGLWEKISSLPEGINARFHKQLHENGVDLSGGERQKLMLAKALYKDAPVLVLDEPTAALDPIAENDMYLRYSELTKGKTSLYISHRLSSTRFCDRILFLEDGQIVEQGSHDELMMKGGKYAEMFRMQSHYYREGDVT